MAGSPDERVWRGIMGRRAKGVLLALLALVLYVAGAALIILVGRAIDGLVAAVVAVGWAVPALLLASAIGRRLAPRIETQGLGGGDVVARGSSVRVRRGGRRVAFDLARPLRVERVWFDWAGGVATETVGAALLMEQGGRAATLRCPRRTDVFGRGAPVIELERGDGDPSRGVTLEVSPETLAEVSRWLERAATAAPPRDPRAPQQWLGGKRAWIPFLFVPPIAIVALAGGAAVLYGVGSSFEVGMGWMLLLLVVCGTAAFVAVARLYGLIDARLQGPRWRRGRVEAVADGLRVTDDGRDAMFDLGQPIDTELYWYDFYTGTAGGNAVNTRIQAGIALLRQGPVEAVVSCSRGFGGVVQRGGQKLGRADTVRPKGPRVDVRPRDLRAILTYVDERRASARPTGDGP